MSALPGRLRRLLWVMCINGALLALEGVLQRTSGSSNSRARLNPSRASSKRFRAANGWLATRNPRPQARQILELTALERILAVDER